MEAFALIMGHLIGDYIYQSDYQAANKTTNSVACLVHCLCYTLAVWSHSFWWMPWWGLVICFVSHFIMDRWRLARVLMKYNYQEAFATGPLAPWSIILVDNIIHLETLLLIYAFAITHNW